MDTWAISTFFIMKNAAMDIYYMSPYGNIFTSLGYPSGVSQEELSCSLELRFNLLGGFPTSPKWLHRFTFRMQSRRFPV